MDVWWTYPLLFMAGLFAGTLNVLAGGGSFLTLPVLIFLGLPAGVANGTNRVGILLQNVAAVWSFDRDGVLDRRAALWATLPATVGAGLGAWLALGIGDRDFERLLAVLMVAVTLVSFWRPAKRDRPVAMGWLALGFFLVGIYGGFIQAGVGFLILAVTSFVGFDLVRGNAIKVLAVLGFTAVALAIFVSADKVHWPSGLALAAGTMIGGLLGARLTVLKGHLWVRWVVTVAVVVFATQLWLRS